MFVQEKNEVLRMPQGRRFSSIEISGDLSLATRKKEQNKLQTNFPGMAKRWHPKDGICHPMTTGLRTLQCIYESTDN